MITNVYEFHQKFGLPLGETNQLDQQAFDFRSKFMQEELNEFREAVINGDQVKAFDALLDLAYVVYGTALFMGVDVTKWHAGMAAVHGCNMAKERAVSAEQSKRGSTFDVIKPAGWVGPEAQLKEILTWETAKEST